MIELFKDVKDVLTVSDIQEILDIGRNSAYRLLKEGKIESVQIGKQYRISKAALIDFFKTGI